MDTADSNQDGQNENLGDSIRLRPSSGVPVAVLRIVSEQGSETDFVITSAVRRVMVGKTDNCDIIVSDSRLARQEFQILVMKDEPETGTGKVRFVAREWTKRNKTLVNGSPINPAGQDLEDGDVLEITGLSFHFKVMRDSSATV